MNLKTEELLVEVSTRKWNDIKFTCNEVPLLFKHKLFIHNLTIPLTFPID